MPNVFEDAFTTSAADITSGYTPTLIAGGAGSGTWSKMTTYAGLATNIDAGKARPPSAGDAAAVCSGTPASGAYDVSALFVLQTIPSNNGLVWDLCAHAATSAANYYALRLQSVSTGQLEATLVKRTGGATDGGSATAVDGAGAVTFVGLGALAAGSYPGKITARVNGSGWDLAAYLQRPSDSFYLKSDGTWQAGSVAFATGTDAGAHGAVFAAGTGALYLYDFSTAGTGIAFDNFVVANAASGAATTTTLSGPASGTVNTAQTYSAALDGTYTGTLTFTPSGSASTGLSAVNVTVTASAATQTASFTPTATGTLTVTLSASPALTVSGSPVNTTINTAPLTAPTLTISSAATGPKLAWSGQAGGTGTLAVDLHRSTTPNYTPGVGTKIATGAASPYTDSAFPGKFAYYKAEVRDSLSATADSNEVPGSTYGAVVSTLKFLGIGHSIIQGNSTGTDPLTECLSRLRAINHDRTCSTVASPTTTAVSGTTLPQWLPGAGAGYYAAHVTPYVGQGVTDVAVMLGRNDSISAATFKSNFQTLISALQTDLAASLQRIWLIHDIYDTASGQLAQNAVVCGPGGYNDQLTALDDGTAVFAVGQFGNWYFGQHSDLLGSDKVHPTFAGMGVLGTFWARDIDARLNPLTVGGRRRIW